MAGSAPWVSPSMGHKYGGSFVHPQAATRDDTPLSNMGTPATTSARHPLIDPDGPLLWVGLLAAASLGLMAYSTSVRVGPVSAAVNVGK